MKLKSFHSGHKLFSIGIDGTKFVKNTSFLSCVKTINYLQNISDSFLNDCWSVLKTSSWISDSSYIHKRADTYVYMHPHYKTQIYAHMYRCLFCTSRRNQYVNNYLWRLPLSCLISQYPVLITIVPFTLTPGSFLYTSIKTSYIEMKTAVRGFSLYYNAKELTGLFNSTLW